MIPIVIHGEHSVMLVSTIWEPIMRVSTMIDHIDQDVTDHVAVIGGRTRCHRSGLDGDRYHFRMPHGGDEYQLWINHDGADWIDHGGIDCG